MGSDSFRDAWRSYVKRNKVMAIIGAVLMIILGVMFLFWPADTEAVMLRIFGVFLLIEGIAFLVTGGTNSVTPVERYVSGVTGALGLLFGILLLINPMGFINVAMVLIGLMLLIHGITEIVRSVDLKAMGISYWSSALVSGIIALIFGILSMTHPFSVIGIIAGISLIYVGISQMIAVRRISRYGKDMHSFMDGGSRTGDDDIIDTTGVESDVDDDRK